MPGDWEMWCTAGVLVAMFLAMARTRVPPDAGVMGALVVLLLAGIVEPTQAVSGFGNPAVITIALLYIVATGLRKTGALAVLSNRVLGRPASTLGAQTRLVFPVAIASAFANNTPIVAAFMPMLTTLARRTGIPAGRLLMPLSFAAILGGLCTLIGTSTTLIVAGLMSVWDGPGEVGTMGMFTITPVGLCVATVGLAYILLLGRALLPGEREETEEPESERQYMTALRVLADSPIVGRSIERAQLRHLPGLFLSRVDRGRESITAVPPHFRIRSGDVLVFVGRLESVVDLQQIRGLKPVADGEEDEPNHTTGQSLVEAVVSSGSPLVGTSVRDAGIRTRYGAVVVAVHRLGHVLEGKVGDIVLKQGDTLLMESTPGFVERYANSAEFHLVNQLEDTTPRHERATLSIAVLALVVLLLSTGVLEPMTSALLGAALMIGLRCCTLTQARRGVDLSVIVVIGGAFGLGQAMTNSGLAQTVAGAIADLTQDSPDFVFLGAIYLITVVFTTFVTNSAAAALMFPVAMSASIDMGVSPMQAAICIAIASSAEFTTPIGYHTNLMVMGPGGYRFGDYARFGGPLTLICAVVTIAATTLLV
ncbi:MAG: SLC13 family permease, partial [Planctomycetota bacterium]